MKQASFSFVLVCIEPTLVPIQKHGTKDRVNKPTTPLFVTRPTLASSLGFPFSSLLASSSGRSSTSSVPTTCTICSALVPDALGARLLAALTLGGTKEGKPTSRLRRLSTARRSAMAWIGSKGDQDEMTNLGTTTRALCPRAQAQTQFPRARGFTIGEGAETRKLLDM
jgi:hypothetical protein